MKRAWVLAAVILLSVSTARGAPPAGSLSEPVLEQIRQFLTFEKGDEWIQTQLRLLEQICKEEDRKYDEAGRIFESFRPEVAEGDRATLESMIERFRRIASNEILYLQEIVLYEKEKRKSFDPNFFHNLVARSAMNAYRLERDAVRARGASAQSAPGQPGQGAEDQFDTLFGPLKDRLWNVRVEKISADPTLIPAERLKALAEAKNNADVRARIGAERAPLLRITDIAAFQSFYEVTLVLYPDDWVKKHGFFDAYEFMQYLLFVEVGAEPPNAKYQMGPLNISRLTQELTRPNPGLPITIVTDAFFEAALPRIDPGTDPLRFLASHSKQAFKKSDLPARTWDLHQFLKSGPIVSGKPSAVTQEVYENRLFVLTAMSDQDFYERYRSVRNDKLFFEQAEKKLGLADLKAELRKPYKVPGGSFELPRYELLGYTKTQFEQAASVREILARIPEQVHIDFIRPLILAIFDKLDPAEREAMAKQRIKEIAAHFGSPAGVTGNRATFRTFFSLFEGDIEEAAGHLAKAAGIPQLEAAKWLGILLCIESRGNLFAVSPTGALGPLQHTYWFYLKTPPPSIPFDPKKSAKKTGLEFGKYYVQYLTGRSAEEAADLAAAAYNQGQDAVRKALEKGNWRANVKEEGRRYAESFRAYHRKLEPARTTADVGEILAAAMK